MSTYSPEQRRVAQAIARQGRKHKANRTELLAAYETALTEAALRNPKSATDHDSLGAFQQRPSSGWGTPAQVTNPDYAAAMFFKSAQGHRGEKLFPGQLSQAVQRSGFPGRYATHTKEAAELIDQFAGGPQAAPAPGSQASPAQSVTSTVFDKAGYQDAQRKSLVGGLIAKHNPNSLLLRLGVFGTGAPDPAAFTNTQVVQQAATQAKAQAPPSGLPTGGGQRAIQWALGKVGTREQGHNRGATVDQIQRRFGMAGQPWCGLFVGNAAKAAGAKGLTSEVASVPAIMRNAKAGRAGFTGWSANPRAARPGDFVVLFGGGHVELVTGVNKDGSVNTIGGNTSLAGGGEGVAKKHRSRGEITGIAHVRYG